MTNRPESGVGASFFARDALPLGFLFDGHSR